ncbi:MAG: hypothetical protein A2X11_13405 [Bacteroidetes bacterium GWE2_42_24]|nr:MAG: hypothetical protein A2X11_13405 [Bacteroidetes bacterium GWE2_42_24]OFY26733.1 MAG: hypothetical protein A2X09_10025 [Bacteroidetes bacterium GWF2_43_11]
MLKRLFSTTLLLLSIILPMSGQTSGEVKEGEAIESKILRHKVKYTVYLPPDYPTSSRFYPVVYLLHGFTGNETDWVQYGQIDQLADKAIRDGLIPPMIIVMPDGDSSWYINDFNGKARYEDMLVNEFLPTIEKEYHIGRAKEFRAIAGLSMGGYGALTLAMRHPDLFASVAALSPAIISDSEMKKRLQNDVWCYNTIFGPLKNDSLPEWWDHYSVLKLATATDKNSLTSVHWYIDCGDDDYLADGSTLLCMILRERKIAHEYRVRNGAHTWEYWCEGIIPALQFIGKNFTR